MSSRHERITHSDDRFRNRVQRLVTSRRVFPSLAIVTVAFAVGVGILVRFFDHKDFQTVGDCVWWAVVTLATVGYRDIVPHSAGGPFIGVIVIVFGITFLSFLIATVTSLFVASDQDAKNAEAEERRAARENEPLARPYADLARRSRHTNAANAAVARKILIAAWHMLSRNEPFSSAPRTTSVSASSPVALTA
jgi:hypothetical protein